MPVSISFGLASTRICVRGFVAAEQVHLRLALQSGVKLTCRHETYESRDNPSAVSARVLLSPQATRRICALIGQCIFPFRRGEVAVAAVDAAAFFEASNIT